MLAYRLVRLYGSKLVGRIVHTIPYGSWPGGFARVKWINKDSSCPEISFFVEGNQIDPDEEKPFGVMGVFENEEVTLTLKRKL